MRETSKCFFVNVFERAFIFIDLRKGDLVTWGNKITTDCTIVDYLEYDIATNKFN